jgi:hypothetical protein
LRQLALEIIKQQSDSEHTHPATGAAHLAMARARLKLF